MGAIVVVVLVALAFAATVIVYAAYPYRGEQTPLSPRVGEVMRRGVDSLPTLDPQASRPAQDADERVPEPATR